MFLLAQTIIEKFCKESLQDHRIGNIGDLEFVKTYEVRFFFDDFCNWCYRIERSRLLAERWTWISSLFLFDWVNFFMYFRHEGIKVRTLFFRDLKIKKSQMYFYREGLSLSPECNNRKTYPSALFCLHQPIRKYRGLAFASMDQVLAVIQTASIEIQEMKRPQCQVVDNFGADRKFAAGLSSQSVDVHPEGALLTRFFALKLWAGHLSLSRHSDALFY